MESTERRCPSRGRIALGSFGRLMTAVAGEVRAYNAIADWQTSPYQTQEWDYCANVCIEARAHVLTCKRTGGPSERHSSVSMQLMTAPLVMSSALGRTLGEYTPVSQSKRPRCRKSKTRNVDAVEVMHMLMSTAHSVFRPSAGFWPWSGQHTPPIQDLIGNRIRDNTAYSAITSALTTCNQYDSGARATGISKVHLEVTWSSRTQEQQSRGDGADV